MDSPEELYESGIFINDLSMHDSSRDFILAGSQQNPELNLALNQVSLIIISRVNIKCVAMATTWVAKMKDV